MRVLLIVLLAALPAHLLAAETPSESVYQLGMTLTDQQGRAVKLDQGRGHPVVITMFYSSCPSVCPLLLGQLKAIDAKLPTNERAQTRFLLVSLDPERDTPEALTALAKRYDLDLARWTLTRPALDDVRKLAAVLGIKYRKLPDGNYNHSSVITVLDRSGLIKSRQEGSSQPAEPVLQSIRSVTTPAAGG